MIRGAKRHAAFLSYSHRDRPWVEAFHRDLEAGLRKHGAPNPSIYFDQAGLRPGEPWVGQLERGLAEAERFVLVVTPEALASPWSQAEGDAFRSETPQRDRILCAVLVPAPLPPFLKTAQYVSFAGCDAESHRQRLASILAWLLDWRSAEYPPELPEPLGTPPAPAYGLPADLRAGLIDALSPIFTRRSDRRLLASELGLEPADLEGYPTVDAAASAALVLAAGDDTPTAGALRAIDQVTRAFGEDEPEAVRALQACKRAIEDHLRAAIRAPAATDRPRSLLEVYREAVVEEHERLVDHFHREHELELLDRIFVDFEIRRRGVAARGRSADRAELAEGGPERLGGGPPRLADLLAFDPGAHPWVTRRWVVLGDPGSGKTTLLRHLASKLAADPAAPTPVFASLPRLLREGQGPLAAAEERLRCSAERAEGLERALENEGQAGRLTLLLDGLDEVAEEHRGSAERLLRRLDRRFPAATLVVTSRPIGYRKPLGSAVEVELLPLDRGRRLEFLARWFARRAEGPARAAAEAAARAQAEAKLPLLAEDPDLWELSGNPLYLTLMALILEAGETPESNRTRLYTQIFDLLLEGRHRDPEGLEVPPLDPKPHVQAALRYLAFSMTEDNRDAEPLDATVERFFREEAEGVLRGLDRRERWRQNPRSFLHDVARRSSIYADHDGPTANWRFWHRTFREALAAERLAEIRAADGPEELLDRARKVAGEESRWAEPFALLTGQVDDPDALVHALLGANRSLGLRALATAPRLRDDTLRQALEITEDREERAAVYRRIPELVGEGERSLRLLDRLRQKTRDGDDLFFLHLAVEETARRYPGPEIERQAQAILERFFAHIPPPPEGLFETAETCEGRGPLWRLVPAGSFLMGSPEGVGENDERPQQRVEIAESFRLGAVPVTNRQYAAFDPGFAGQPWDGVYEKALGDHPVVNVSWYAAVSFCRWLGQALPAARGAGLPTEEDWEYACRAGSQSAYSSGDKEEDLARVGWYSKNSGGRTHETGRLSANRWNFHDLHGQVWEWTASLWRPDYLAGAENLDPISDRRVLRGGSWVSPAANCRSAYRLSCWPGDWIGYIGFRVRLPAPEPD